MRDVSDAGGAGNVHVHLLSLAELAREGEAAALALLSAQERAALDRAKAPQRRAELLFGRAALRRVLAGYTGIAAERLELGRDRHNKPCLLGAASAWSFNLAHSGDRYGIVVAAGGAVGIDLESSRDQLGDAMMPIAERQFSPAEWRLLQNQPAAQREREFYRMWTLKEAILKAAGVGLYYPLHAVEVAGAAERYRIYLVNPEVDLSVEAAHWRDSGGGDGHVAVARVGWLGTVTMKPARADQAASYCNPHFLANRGERYRIGSGPASTSL